jgi:hypothetical protein
MAATLYELATSRDFTVSQQGAEVVRKWISLGSRDETEVYAAALAANALVFDGLIRKQISATYLGGLAYSVEVTYGVLDGSAAAGVPGGGSGGGLSTGGAPTDAQPNGPDGVGTTVGGLIGVEITAQTTHITQSHSTLYLRSIADGIDPESNTAPSYEKAIGVSDDKVEGCDILAGKLEFTVERTREALYLPYLRTLANLVGTLNDSTFWGFEAREVLYLGASGRFSGDGADAPARWTFTHKFAAGSTQYNLEIGNTLFVPEKGPFDYLWVRYQNQKVGNATLQIPEYAYLEEVYPVADFFALEIGV